MILLYSSISSLWTADVFPVMASLPQRSGDRKYVCGSQAILSPAGQKNLNKCSIDISFLEKKDIFALTSYHNSSAVNSPG